MNFYNIYSEQDGYIGVSTLKTKNSTSKAVKPLENGEKAFFRDGKWVYEYNPLPPLVFESKYSICDYFPERIYTTQIYPENGTLLLEKDKKISVLIPCFGKSEFLVDCINSCLSQTLLPYCVVVLLMDEKSIQLKEILETNQNVKCYESKRMNICEARSKLVHLCPTEWFLFLDADDMLAENCLETLYKEQASVVFPAVRQMSQTGEFIDDDPIHYLPAKEGHHSACLQLNMTALMPKTIFYEVGLDNNLCLGGEDFDFNLRLIALKKYKVSCVWTTFYAYRQVENGLSKNKEFYESHFQAVIKNIEFLHSEFVEIKGFDEFEQTFYLSPKLELVASLNKFNDARDFLVGEKRDILAYKRALSKRRNPIDAWNDKAFVTIGGKIDYSFLIGKTFDVLFLEEPSLKCFSREIPMVINAKILDKIKDKKGWEKLVYLYDNYACFDLGGDVSFDCEKIFEDICKTKHKSEETEKQLELIKTPEKKYKANEIKNISFSLHLECNENCSYCNQVELKKSYKKISDEEMLKNFDKAVSFCEKTYKKFYPFILGGEPTLWSDDFIEKILKRLTNYKQIKVFTNGFDQESLWYKCDKVVLYKHIIDWVDNPEKVFRKNLKKNEIAQLVITSKDIDILEKYVIQYPEFRYAQISPCQNSSDLELNLKGDNFEKFQKISSEYFPYNSSTCFHGVSKEISCYNLEGKWCCLWKRGVALNNITYCKAMCDSCCYYQE